MLRSIVFFIILLMGSFASTQAQTVERPQPKVMLGFSAAANMNFFSGTTQTINSALVAPGAFHEGFGVRPYGSLLVEYRPHPVWGLMLNLGYDGRGGEFDGVDAPCNCPEELETSLAYFTIEPSLRIAPFASNLYLFVGGGLGININKGFEYTQELKPDTDGDFSAIRKNLFSGHIGAGYDIPLSSATKRTQVFFSPFVSYHPYFGRDPRSIESWSIQSLRVGAAIKFGRVRQRPEAEEYIPVVAPVVKPVIDEGVDFSVVAPSRIEARRTVRETFPLRNYVFFEEGRSSIPNRYVALNKEEAIRFKEGQFQDPEPTDLSGRSQRQLSIYYNILNIVGDRMRVNPDAKIALIGASAGNGPQLGKEYAESVKRYLVDVFAIGESRITTEGRNLPLVPSEKPGDKKFLALLKEGDRRVDLTSTSNALLAPLQVVALEDDSRSNMLVFKMEPKTRGQITSWTLDVTDESGTNQRFGPYTSSQESISGNVILGNRSDGNYKAVMLAKTKSGTEIKRESNFRLAKNTTPVEDGLRYSILFDFDHAQTVTTYEKFLTEVVVPLIPNASTVGIHGYTDIIGNESYNMSLSKRRANDAHKILQQALNKAGKRDVKFDVGGYGADTKRAPFGNRLPEERSYNRTVIIDIAAKQ